MADTRPPLPPGSPTASPAQLDRAVVAVGVAALSATVVLSTVYTRQREDIDWTNYLAGLAATAVLLGIAAITRIRGAQSVTELVSWTGAAGILGTGAMLGVAIDDAEVTSYVVGLLLLAMSVGGYAVQHSWTFVVTGIAGLGLFYVQLVDDIFESADVGQENIGMYVSVALFAFTACVTAVTWALPERVTGGVVAGLVSIVGNFFVVTALVFLVGFVVIQPDDPFADPPGSTPFDAYHNDVWVVLVLSLVLVAAWTWCAWRTGSVGFRLLIIGNVASVLPAATLALAVERPSLWAAVAGVLGTAALGLLIARGMREPRVGAGR